MEAEDPDIPPASPDEAVQQFIDTMWRESARAAREGRESIRKIYPELLQHLPETASRHMKRALSAFEEASLELHYAGAHVLGQSEYDEYIAATTRRQITS